MGLWNLFRVGKHMRVLNETYHFKIVIEVILFIKYFSLCQREILSFKLIHIFNLILILSLN